MKKYDVIVVGAGISGLLAALILSKHGKKVLVLEKKRHLGGNCNSYLVDGYQVDTGAHAITHLIEGPLKRLMDNYFDFLPVFEDYGHYYIRTEKALVKVPSNLKDFVTFDVLPRMDRVLLSQALTKAVTLSLFGIDLFNQSVYDFLPKNLSKDTSDFVDTICVSLSGKSMKETSVQRVLSGSSFVRDSITQEQFDAMIGKLEPKTYQSTESILASILSYYPQISLQTSLTKVTQPFTSFERLATNDINYSQGYPRKGLKALLNAILYSIPEKIVEIKKECEVKSILTQDGNVSGVEADEIYTSDIVIYTGFATELPGLIKDLPPEYIGNLKGIVHSKSLTIWLGLERELSEFNYTGSEIWFKDFCYWATPISNYDSSLAPKGKQLIGFSFVIDNKNEEQELKKAYDTIFRAHPNIEKYIEMKHEQIMIPEKAAVTINGKFADIRTPVKNLYIAGTDADKRSMGITRASYSIIELLKILNEDGNLH